MSRIVSIWLPAWPVERMQRQSPGSVPADAPVALVTTGARGLRISAANAPALAAGVEIGISLADARAALPSLLTRPAEPDRDARALAMLAGWLGRYGPSRHVDGNDGAWIDVTGVPHLFGGEPSLCADLARRLHHLGLTPHIGVADTLGAAHALARFATPAREASPRPAIAPAGGARAALAGLPVAALRLGPEATRLLIRLGLKRIGQLYGLPRAALAARFRGAAGSRQRAERAAVDVLMRLDQALGLIAEPLHPLEPPPETMCRLAFPEPLITAEGLEQAVDRIVGQLTELLAAQGLGARRVHLLLFRTDGTVGEARIGASTPCRDPAHIRRLLAEKLGALDAGFGVDVICLEARQLEPLGDQQVALDTGGAEPSRLAAAALVDRLVNRLGPARVITFASRASHMPEHAGSWVPAHANHDRAATVPPRVAGPPRPHLLLAPPEPITVIAEVPEGAPQSFVWRRTSHRVVRSEGPERIAPEWWRPLSAGVPASGRQPRTRDYYRLEDITGGRFWVFREGLYDRSEEEPDLEDDAPATSGTDAGPRWFMHGLFG